MDNLTVEKAIAPNVLCKKDVPLPTVIDQFSVKQRHVMSTIIFHMIKRMTFLQLLVAVARRLRRSPF